MEVGGQRHTPAALPLGKRPGAHFMETGWAPGPVWRGAENLVSSGIRSLNGPSRSESLQTTGISYDKIVEINVLLSVKVVKMYSGTDRCF